MKLIWTKSSKPLSILIRWGLTEPVSHFAIVFDNFLVFQSNLLGVGLAVYSDFVKHCEVVYSVDVELPLQEEEAIYKSIIPLFVGRAYDWKAFAYFCYRGFLQKVFRIPIPKISPFNTNSNKTEICVELIKALPEWMVPPSLRSADMSILSPYTVYLEFKAFYSEAPK